MDPTASILSCRVYGRLVSITAKPYTVEWFSAHLLGSQIISDESVSMVSPVLDFPGSFVILPTKHPMSR